MGVELGNHSQVDIQLALNNVAECHVVREPKLISRLNKFSVTEIILVDFIQLFRVGRTVFYLHGVRSHFHR